MSELVVDTDVLGGFLTGEGGPRSRRSCPEAEPQDLDEAPRYIAVGGLALGRDGRVSVRTRSLHPQTGLPVQDRPWLVFERDGSLVGRLVQPEDVRILSFADGHVLGIVGMTRAGQQLGRYRLVAHERSNP